MGRRLGTSLMSHFLTRQHNKKLGQNAHTIDLSVVTSHLAGTNDGRQERETEAGRYSSRNFSEPQAVVQSG